MGRLLLALFVALTACAQAAPRTPAPPPAPTITLRVTPPMVLAGHAVWITCYVPEALGLGWIRYGIDGLRVSGPESVQHVQNRLLIEPVPCGTWTAFCQFIQRESRRAQQRTHTLDAGSCQP